MVNKNETAAPTGIGGGGETEKPGSKSVFDISIFASISASNAAPEEPELPQVAVARERDREARGRIKLGRDYTPSQEELLQARAWRRKGRR